MSSKDVKYGVPTGITNDTLAHSAAHETGHQIDNWSGGNLSSSSEMATAWNRDLALMALQPPCRWNAPIANTDPQQYVTRDGVFSGAVDYKGNFICTGGPDGSGENSIYGGSSVDVLYQAYPYFGQTNLPLSEVFPEVFANLSGFWDTISNSGGNIDGSSRVDGSMALQCTRIYVWAWSNFGRNPTTPELQSGVYSQPAGTKTKYTNCDGTVTEEDNSGS